MSKITQVDPAANAQLFILQDRIHEPMHDRFLWATMMRRDAEAAAIPEWEELREIASKIKEHTLTHLDELFAALNYLFQQAKQQALMPAEGEKP